GPVGTPALAASGSPMLLPPRRYCCPVVPVSRVVRLPSRDLVSFRSPSDHDRNGTTLVIRTDSPNCHMQSRPCAPVVPHHLFTGRYGIRPRLLTCLTSFSGVSHTVPSSGRRATARFRL